jgi:pullulanase/glycogen debranching enzyme
MRTLVCSALFCALTVSGVARADALADCNAEPLFRVLRAQAQAAATASALWLDDRHLRWPHGSANGRFSLHFSPDGQIQARNGSMVVGAAASTPLQVHTEALADTLEARFRWFGPGVTLRLPPSMAGRIAGWHRGQLLLVEESADGRVLRSARLQHPAALDAMYADAATQQALGSLPTPGSTRFALWAPTAQLVQVCDYPDASSDATRVLPLQRSEGSGVWTRKHPEDLRHRYYNYLVDVFVPGLGLVRNRVTDPYSLGLSAQSQRSQVIDLDDPATQPEGWSLAPRPAPLETPVDAVIYELHVRDFSLLDARVPAAERGKYRGFTHPDSHGMRHLKALAEAGLTDIHLLPVFDFASVPEQGCIAPTISGAGDSAEQQSSIDRVRGEDCFNWGYDPLHFNAPEGSYASDAADGRVRIREFREMVMALHAAGLRVGMDVVYNHTSASGQQRHSVLDSIVPGYYQRLNREGGVETSTCCANTATEHAMMAKLMIDSAVIWARDYRIDSFRFDLMGHQPRAAMERLQAAVDRATGRRIDLLGEGWNFGEVADGSRFVQASQLSLNGSGIATFSDRARDAVRGGGCCDSGEASVREQGYVNGQFYAPNASAGSRFSRNDLMRSADMVRVGLAGSLRHYEMLSSEGSRKRLDQIAYAGSQPAGYVSQPDEVVNYVENHDNQTLFDINVLKLPVDTPPEERARVQILAAAINAFSQGIAYYHAGIDVLRSKSLDRNSYDSGDWFNRVDWSYQDNFFPAGLPPAWDNQASWNQMRPRLATPALKPAPEHIDWTRRAFLDLLRIRDSTPLFRLRTADAIVQRLSLPNTGPQQVPTVLVGLLDGREFAQARFARLVYAVNVGVNEERLALPELAGTAWQLHPVHTAADAADRRAAEQARLDSDGLLTVPARTAVVFVSGPSA